MMTAAGWYDVTDQTLPVPHTGASGPCWHDGAVTTPQPKTAQRNRMTGPQRRQQLIEVGRALFAERGFEGTTVEEIAASAGVSKPVVYEHFGGKEGLYAVVVDREVQVLLSAIREALTAPAHPRQLVEQAALALLAYIEESPDGFRILVRDSPPGAAGASYRSILGDIAGRVEDIMVEHFTARGFEARLAPMYAQMLVGIVATTGQWWLEVRRPAKEVVGAHLVNLAWNGLAGLEQKPRLGRS